MSRASLRNSSNTSILSLAIAVTSFIFVVDEGDAVALVLPGPAVSYTTSWDTTRNVGADWDAVLRTQSAWSQQAIDCSAILSSICCAKEAHFVRGTLRGQVS